MQTCAYCARKFDPEQSRGCGSITDLSGRGRGALSITNYARFCDFIEEHPGRESTPSVEGGVRFWTCCGGEVGYQLGCHVCVVPHSTKKNDAVRARLLASRAAPDPPRLEKAVEQVKCHYCPVWFNKNMPRRVGGIAELDRSRHGGCSAILDTSEFCDYVLEHRGPVREVRRSPTQAYRYYACCDAEVGTTFGCRCVVLQHSEQVDTYRDEVMKIT